MNCKNILMNKKIYIRLLFLLAFATSWAQQEETENSPLGLSTSEYFHFISSQQVAVKSATTSNSSVFVTQIGDYNSLTTQVTTLTDQSVYTQIGDNNHILVLAETKSLNQSIQQQGEGNYFQSYGNDPYANHSIQVNQNGINQDITVFGNNSMSDKMIINMNGTDSSLIVRNF